MKKIKRILADFIDFWLCFIPGFFLSILLQPKPYVYADIINIFFGKIKSKIIRALPLSVRYIINRFFLPFK